MKKFMLLAAVVLLVSSCGAYKRLAYLQDMDSLVTYDVTQHPNPRIAQGDKLKITVMSTNASLSAPFNLISTSDSYDAVTEQSSYVVTGSDSDGYLVDTDGCINFPILGKIFVEGMTIEELNATIAGQIMEKRYILDPVVKSEFTNFKITILGEVGHVGNFTIPTGGINIFQALALAGDMKESALRDNLWVIRTTGDTRKVYTLNPKSRSVFDSPAFYLQQNDLIYVAPRDNKRDTDFNNRMSTFQLIFTTITSLLTTYMWFIVYTR